MDQPREPSTVRARRILAELKRLGSKKNVAGMARFGIVGDDPFGVSVATLRKIAKREGKDHDLALALWKTKRHEARILASLVAEPERLTAREMETFVREFRSWDVCDAFALNLFDRSPLAWAKTREWATREREFEKRAGFALMAGLASHDKEAPDAKFLALLPFVERAADDDRNFVRKAVNWALRGIGKRNARLRRAAIAAARRLAERDSRAARWIGRDALRELSRR